MGRLSDTVQGLIKNHNLDIFVYSGSVSRDAAIKFRHVVRTQKEKSGHTRAMLFMTTYGGCPDAAYMIARCMQDNYETFIFAAGGMCKSAGTIVALGAHQIIMGPDGELGPLDVQIAKEDELLGSMNSGLDVMKGLNTTQGAASEAFIVILQNIIGSTRGRLTTKTASELSLQLAQELYKPITAQIDPAKLGETQRAIDIAKGYGQRLANYSDNIKDDALNSLIYGYPCHGFVIDLREAKTLFNRVESMTNDVLTISDVVCNQEPNSISIRCLNVEYPEKCEDLPNAKEGTSVGEESKLGDDPKSASNKANVVSPGDFSRTKQGKQKRDVQK